MSFMDRDTAAALRTAGVEEVLAIVRRTGKSAHQLGAHGWSTPVFCAAMNLGLNPVQLQAEVEAYADAMDVLADR